MKKFTQDDYVIIQELLKEKLVDLGHYSYMKYTDLDRLNKAIDTITVLKEKVEERIKNDK